MAKKAAKPKVLKKKSVPGKSTKASKDRVAELDDQIATLTQERDKLTAASKPSAPTCTGSSSPED